MTKSFFHGRTEAGRSCTTPAAEFAQAWLQTAISLPGDIASATGVTNEKEEFENAVGNNQAEKLRDLFHKAWNKQQQMTKECSKGKGVERQRNLGQYFDF